MENRDIAQHLLKLAHSLEKTHASLYRVQAYRRAAETILGLDRPVEDIVVHAGRRGLTGLPGIGVKMSARIETLVRTGEIANVNKDETEQLPGLRTVQTGAWG